MLAPATSIKNKGVLSFLSWILPFYELLVGEERVEIISMPVLAHSRVGSQNDLVPIE